MSKPFMASPHGALCQCIACRVQAVNPTVAIGRVELPPRVVTRPTAEVDGGGFVILTPAKMIPQAVFPDRECGLDGCTQLVTRPKRGRIPRYCSEAHKKAAWRAAKKKEIP